MKSQSIFPLNEKTSKLLSQLVDAHYELDSYKKSQDSIDFYYLELAKKNFLFFQIESSLIKEIGRFHYEHIMNMGKKMFS